MLLNAAAAAVKRAANPNGILGITPAGLSTLASGLAQLGALRGEAFAERIGMKPAMAAKAAPAPGLSVAPRAS